MRPCSRAMQALPDTARLLVAGHIRPPVQRLVAELGLEQQVVFAGSVPDPAPLYCAADVSVLPSYYDPASKVVIESLMMGTPAITTAYNGSRDFIDGGDHPLRGRVVEEPDDVAGLAHAMAELADPAEHARCVDGLGDLRDELSMRTHAARLEVVLAEAAENS
ncbi:MAG: glycosyltransferase family 4 protein [Planctomycetota bacterium]